MLPSAPVALVPPARAAGLSASVLRAALAVFGATVSAVNARPSLIEFPADDARRARRFWSALLGEELDDRPIAAGQGWQTQGAHPAVGVHERGRGPGDTHALAYFEVADLSTALERVVQLGGSVIHDGTGFAVCRDSEGTPFGLAGAQPGES